MRNTIAFLISLIIALFIPAGSAFSQRQADAEASVSGISAGSSEGTENSAVGRFFSKKPNLLYLMLVNKEKTRYNEKR